MKVTLLVTELFFVFLLSWISYLKSTWALHQIKGGQKHGDAQTCQMWCIGYFFGTLWVTLWEILIKLLVQLRNFPFTTKSYFYTFATFSTFRKNMTNYHKVKKSEYFLKNLYFHVINTFIEMCFNRPISCSKKVL